MFRKHILLLLILISTGLLHAQTGPKFPWRHDMRSNFIIQKEGRYALGDSGLWYKDSPIADTILHIGENYFAFGDAKRIYTIYDTAYKPVASGIQEIRTFGGTMFLKDAAGWRPFSDGKFETDERMDSIYIAPDCALLYKDGKQGGVFKTGQTELFIAPNYDKAGPYYDGILLIRNNKLGWIHHGVLRSSGDSPVIDIPVAYDHIYKQRNDVMAVVSGRGTEYYNLNTGKKIPAEPSDSVVFYDNNYKIVRGGKQSLYGIQDDKPAGEVQGLRIHPMGRNNLLAASAYSVVVKDSLCAIYKNGVQTTPFEYENVLPESQVEHPVFRVVKDHKVAVVNETGEYQLGPLYTDVYKKYDDYYCAYINGKAGIFLKGDSVILSPEYLWTWIENRTYATITKNGAAFGLYDYRQKKQVLPCEYENIIVDSTFITGRKKERFDIYFQGVPVLQDMQDAQVYGSTAKGYKDGKVYVGYAEKGKWDVYSYEIPSYKIVKDKNSYRSLHAWGGAGVTDVFDYVSGKWGYYDFPRGTWTHQPIAHSSEPNGGTRLLDFPCDTSLLWQGINFTAKKKVAVINEAWSEKKRYNWIDLTEHSYSHEADNIIFTVSPVLYSAPGHGKCYNHYNGQAVNHVFKLSNNKSVLQENGEVVFGKKGELSLSEYYCILSANGCQHPQSISDYEQIISPYQRLSFKGGDERVLNDAIRNAPQINIGRTFEWLSKKENAPFISRSGRSYGLLNEGGEYSLKPEYVSIRGLENSAGQDFVVGVRCDEYKVYDPATNKFSGTIPDLITYKGALLLTGMTDSLKYVLNEKLDTLYKTTDRVELLNGVEYAVKDPNTTTVFQGKTRLFSFDCQSVERINAGHFYAKTLTSYILLTSAGTVVTENKSPLRYTALGECYVLQSGTSTQVFDKQDKLLYEFGRQPFEKTADEKIIVKDKESVTIFNGTSKIVLKGKYAGSTKDYIITNKGKYKTISDYNGAVLLPKVKNAKALVNSYVAVQEGKKYFLVNFKDKERKQIKSLNAKVEDQEISYEDQDGVEAFMEVKSDSIYRIDEKGGMFGLLKSGETLLPHRYFSMIPFSNSYLVQDKVRYRLYSNGLGAFINQNTYDAIYPYKFQYMVVDKGKISYIDWNGKPTGVPR